MIRRRFDSIRRRLRAEVAGLRAFQRLDHERREQARRIIAAFDSVGSPWWRRRRRLDRIRFAFGLALIGIYVGLIALSFLVQPEPPVKVNPRLNPEALRRTPDPRSLNPDPHRRSP